MKIRTTVNILTETLEKIEHAAMYTGKSKNEMIILLIMEGLKNKETSIGSRKTVKYQVTAPKEEWEKSHLSVSGAEYEYLLDVRKFLKMSVSFLLAVAVREYLMSLIKKIKSIPKKRVNLSKDLDNYLYLGYASSVRVTKNGLHLGVHWGNPRH